ncbi:hypothetical protein ElyMa_005609100 [Elysia marginata]|uniref:CTNNB1 binding N-teminal domain-containing protein n=1 Tax=Elysia marginata TaxID=1093978 RepID=A0AAV4F525_9GAST|nr:hypothetical protein ElyMa_005609100 [Elysia marginata]
MAELMGTKTTVIESDDDVDDDDYDGGRSDDNRVGGRPNYDDDSDDEDPRSRAPEIYSTAERRVDQAYSEDSRSSRGVPVGALRCERPLEVKSSQQTPWISTRRLPSNTEPTIRVVVPPLCTKETNPSHICSNNVETYGENFMSKSYPDCSWFKYKPLRLQNDPRSDGQAT